MNLDFEESSGKDIRIMKKVYEKPMMMFDVFAADEYVAACEATSVTEYKFECNAKAAAGLVFIDKNRNGRLDWDDLSATALGYHACSATTTDTHDITERLEKGWILYDPENREVMQDVYIWTENNTNVHCTTNIDSAEKWLEANFS